MPRGSVVGCFVVTTFAVDETTSQAASVAGYRARMQNTGVLWGSTLAVLLTVAGACSKETERAQTTEAAGAPAVEPPAPPPAPPPEPSPLEKLLATPSLADAIELVRPEMTDTDDETSPGAIMLGLWASEHLKLADVNVRKNETSFPLVRKDSDASRGKRMCIRGRLIQISKEKAGARTLWTGLMLIGYSEIASFIAAGSTGNLVQNSRARLCGVVIGTYDYSNSAGGKGHAVSMVGMFDLAANRDN